MSLTRKTTNFASGCGRPNDTAHLPVPGLPGCEAMPKLMFASSSERPTPRDFVILFMGFSFTKLVAADSHSEFNLWAN